MEAMEIEEHGYSSLNGSLRLYQRSRRKILILLAALCIILLPDNPILLWLGEVVGLNPRLSIERAESETQYAQWAALCVASGLGYCAGALSYITHEIYSGAATPSVDHLCWQAMLIIGYGLTVGFAIELTWRRFND